MHSKGVPNAHRSAGKLAALTSSELDASVCPAEPPNEILHGSLRIERYIEQVEQGVRTNAKRVQRVAERGELASMQAPERPVASLEDLPPEVAVILQKMRADRALHLPLAQIFRPVGFQFIQAARQIRLKSLRVRGHRFLAHALERQDLVHEAVVVTL